MLAERTTAGLMNTNRDVPEPAPMRETLCHLVMEELERATHQNRVILDDLRQRLLPVLHPRINKEIEELKHATFDSPEMPELIGRINYFAIMTKQHNEMLSILLHNLEI